MDPFSLSSEVRSSVPEDFCEPGVATTIDGISSLLVVELLGFLLLPEVEMLSAEEEDALVASSCNSMLSEATGGVVGGFLMR